MKRASRSIFTLSLCQNLLSQTKPSSSPIRNLPILRPFCATTKPKTETANTTNGNGHVPTKPTMDSLILEKLRQRKLQGSSKTTEIATPGGGCSGRGVVEAAARNCEETKDVSSFEELGLKEEFVLAAGEMGIWVPSEIQCVGIPAVLERKSVVLSAGFGSGRTLAYLLPLIQLLRQDETLSRMKPNHPIAIILCCTEEQCDEVFRMAKLFIDFAWLKSVRENGQSDEAGEADAPIGLLIGTPSEISQQLTEGSILSDDIKYLVLDEADNMFTHGFTPEINEIVSPLKSRKSDCNHQRFQTIFVTSTMTEMLGKEFSTIMERLEHDNVGKVTAMMLEMEQSEVLDIIESPEGLKKKIGDAIESLTSGS